MPPRRSSRARASVEPQPEPATAKRKREYPDEKENVRSKSRTKVPEVVNEEPDEEAPPVKKSRPSLEPDSDDDERPAPRSRKARKAVEPSSDEDEEEEEPPKKGKKRVSRRKAVSDDDGDEDEDTAPLFDGDSDEEEAVKPKKGKAKRAPAKPKAKPKAAAKPRPTASAPRGPPTPAKPLPRMDEDESGEEDTDKITFDAPPVPTPAQLAQPAVEEPTGPKSRLVIHKMALVNFKSYAGRQEIGPFHKSFSAIVGPNGSGKSNTIDALLFVFGYRASKMRQGKLSELIHNSSLHQEIDECSVEVHFREIIDLPGPDEFEVVPDTQLIVTRTAFKNNSSKYTINGRTSTFTEVQTLLKGRGIDLDHKRFLILQGEVESIAQMKPKGSTEHEDGLLEYLEDIIGTSGYVTPIAESMAQIEVLQEERASKMQRVRIVEKEKNSLEAKKREAENYLKLKNEKTRAENRWWQWHLWRAFEAEKVCDHQIKELTEELAEEQTKNKDDIEHYESLKADFEEREAAYEAFRQDVKAHAAGALKDLAKNQKDQVQLEERLKHANAQAKKCKKSLTEDKTALTKARRTIEESSDKIERERSKVEQFESELEEAEKLLEKIRDSLKDKTQVFHDQIEAKQKELQPWTGKIDAKRAEVDVATSERDALATKAQAFQESMDKAASSLAELETEQKDKHARLEKYKTDKKSHQTAIANAEKNQHDAQQTVQEWRGRVSTARQKVAEAKQAINETATQSKVVDGLTRLKNTGRISGFHGRLGSLGTIPDKYDVAISTACPALHNMVVDKVDQAQSCIQHLREQNLGRATFTVLEKLRNDGMEKIATPEDAPRLFDLVNIKEPRFAKAFYKALGNTLVAENMEQANRIAFGARRWRVVTLAGQLIETTGAMSGGGNQQARGAMSSKFAPQAVGPEVMRGLEADLAEADKHLNTATAKVQSLETELDGLRRAVPEMETAFQKLGLDIEIGKNRISEATKRVSDLKAQNKNKGDDGARIAKLDDSIRKAQSELDNLLEKADKIKDAIKSLEDKILQVGGSKLLTQKSAVEGLKLHISIANDEITKAEVAKSKAEKDLGKFEAAVKLDGDNLEQAEAEVDELNSKVQELVAAGHDLQNLVDEAKAAVDESKDTLDTLKKTLDEQEELIQTFRLREVEIQKKLAEAEKTKATLSEELQNYSDQLEDLKLEEVDEDDDEEEGQEGGDEAKPDAQAAPAGEPADPDVKMEVDDNGDKAKGEGSAASPNELPTFSAEELKPLKRRDLLADLELLDEKLKRMQPNLDVLKEYKKQEKVYFERVAELDATTKARDAEKAKYDGLRKRRLDEFMTGFNLISLKLKEMYQMITLGGNAELELVDSMDPFSEGIIFSVMPPKKSWKNISNLSGGEKARGSTLSSLALVFALHVFKPTPLYFMDEIDAALDFRNVSIVANYIKDRTKNAQFIIISLRNDMFELSHRLIGIYKTSNATRSISIDNHALHSTIPT
ncbi:SMC hinge domain-containing protein [Mycena chlorophos]|uniref:Structural maintenance of chromosomes protein n=1 Tax=Mycena chlorophos TaxID=658473 RepID=A0A8H6SG18_MYCCL|nr:SMC hinge domain-containing protein [Mycena chlorophos]